MKKYLLPLLMLVLAVEALNPLHASSQDKIVSPKKKIVVKSGIKLEIAKPKVEIVLGESESQKQAKVLLASSKRQLVARERPAEETVAVFDLSLDELRNLYRSAGAKYGVDWRLIEAVHQVETGKSSQCKRNPSGATGPMQFLPSTFRHYSEGGDICNLQDSVFAAANLLAQAGAASGDIDSALFSYNHSQSYVNLVKSVMNSI